MADVPCGNVVVECPDPCPPCPPVCQPTGAWIQILDSPQEIPLLSAAPIDFDDELFALLPTTTDLAANTIIIGVDGFYLVGFGITFEPGSPAPGSGDVITQAFLQNRLITGMPSTTVTAGGAASVSTSDAKLVPLFAGDVVALVTINGADANLPILSAALSVWLMGCFPGGNPTCPPCPPASASIITDGPQIFGLETTVDFEVDVHEELPFVDAQAMNERIVIGVDAVYSVTYSATYNSPFDATIRTRIKINDATQINRLDQVTGGVPLQITEKNDFDLVATDFITVTVAVEAGTEAASVEASLTAEKVCEPATGIIPQG
jgi:hypothetical protein